MNEKLQQECMRNLSIHEMENIEGGVAILIIFKGRYKKAEYKDNDSGVLKR